ncbi:aminoglycoside phosphotransferase family protein [Phytomonospora sp. NPDC050363]|uniref:aminoglycoside phosphotransferase family protein n=1 Tax=Phytomonospora sp. NPDC050363 TaxID=3155642 RepID=UPI0033E4D1E2
MITFSTHEDYQRHVGDLDAWWPHAEAVLDRHGLHADGPPSAAGGGSYPTILAGDLVVKFYGHAGQWRQAHATELRAYALLATDPAIAAPRLLASGGLGDDWAYLVISRVTGRTWAEAKMPPDLLRAAATDLGAHIARVHALRPGPDIARVTDLPALDFTPAHARSALPKRFVAQAAEFVTAVGPDDPAFGNGDLFEGNILVDHGRVTGLIDWGDALVIDRHNELAKIHLSTFRCDKDLLRAFLDGSNWPAGKDFARRAMAMALVRQAVGVGQHGGGFDNFYLIPGLPGLDDIGTLDELAEAVFGV